MDYVGRSPLLFKEGFRGMIIATRPTFELARVIMLDSAHLLKEKYLLKFKKTICHIWQNYSFTKRFANLSITFHNAGHILGSAFIEISFLEKGIKKMCCI